MNRFIILGSANAVPKIGQENTHLYAQAANKRILVDWGDNALVSLKKNKVDPNTITDLVLTHFHPDHAGSLPLFIMTMWLEKRTLPLKIHGLEFTLDRAKALLGLFGWNNWAGIYPVSFNPVNDEGLTTLIQDVNVKVTGMPVKHLIPTIGLRIDFKDGKSVTYSCDTEPCENLMSLAKGADILLQESAGPGKGHTSAAQAGEIATTANVKHLVLIHYDQSAGGQQLIKAAQENYKGEVSLAVDGMSLF
jgi:ribonuclease Z